MVPPTDKAGDAVFVIEPISGTVILLPNVGGVVKVEAGIVESGVEGDVADVGGMGARRLRLRVDEGEQADKEEKPRHP